MNPQRTLRMWQVQAQLVCVTPDGWDSSRQCPTMVVGSWDAHSAVRTVSDAAWDMSGRSSKANTRKTMASVVQVDRYGAPIGLPVLVKVEYINGGVSTVNVPNMPRIPNQPQ